MNENTFQNQIMQFACDKNEQLITPAVSSFAVTLTQEV